eukprot:4713436-Pleurochrysis_carterae.AAC.4
MPAAAHWDGAWKGTVFAAVAHPSRKGMQGYGHWPGLLVGEPVPAIIPDQQGQGNRLSVLDRPHRGRRECSNGHAAALNCVLNCTLRLADKRYIACHESVAAMMSANYYVRVMLLSTLLG